MNLYEIIDNKFHTGQPDAVRRKTPPAKGCIGSCDIQHDPYAHFRDRPKVDFLFGILQFSLVHPALHAFCTTDRNLIVTLQFFHGIFSPDHCRNAQFAADNSRMTRPASMFGHNCRCPFHNRSPIRISHFCYQHRSILEIFHFFDIVENTDFAAGDCISHRKADDQFFTLLFKVVMLQGGARLL